MDGGSRSHVEQRGGFGELEIDPLLELIAWATAEKPGEKAALAESAILPETVARVKAAELLLPLFHIVVQLGGSAVRSFPLFGFHLFAKKKER